MARRSRRIDNTKRFNKKALDTARKKTSTLSKMSNTNFVDGTAGDGAIGVGILKTRPNFISGFDPSILDKKNREIKTSSTVAKFQYFMIQDENPNIRGSSQSQYVYYIVEPLYKISVAFLAKQLGVETSQVFALTENEYLNLYFEHASYINQDYEKLRIKYQELPKYDQRTPGRMDDAHIGYSMVSSRPSPSITQQGRFSSPPYTDFYIDGFDSDSVQVIVPSNGIVQFIDSSPTKPSQIRPSSWSWSFGGDGVSPTGSTEQTPIVDYSNALQGYYTVDLVATNIHGSTQKIKTDYVYWDSDQDAQAFFDLIDAEDGTYLSYDEKIATVNLIKGLKNNNLDQKIIIFPFLGGNMAGAKYPIALNSTKDQSPITWGSGVTGSHITKYGYELPGDSTNYGVTNITVDADCESQDNLGFGAHFVHDPTDETTRTVMDVRTAAVLYDIAVQPASNRVLSRIGENASLTDYIDSSESYRNGFYYISRTTNSQVDLYRNGEFVDEYTTAATTLSFTYPFNIGGTNLSNSPAGSFKGRISFALITFEGLSASDASILNTLMEAWLIGTGRYTEPNMATYFGSTEVVDNKHIEALSLAWVNSGMTSTIWDKVRIYSTYAPGSLTDALTNIKNPGTYDATAVNSPDLKADGFDHTTSQYLDANYNVALESTNQVSFGVYAQEATAGPYTTEHEYMGTWAQPTRLYTDLVSGESVIRAEFGTTTSDNSLTYIVTGNESTIIGSLIACKDSSNNIYLIHNGTTVASSLGTATNANKPSDDFFVGARNISGSPDRIAGRKLSAHFVGYQLTEDENKIIASFMEEEMKIRGISVIENTIGTEDDAYLQNVADSGLYFGVQESKAKIQTIQELVNSGIWNESDLIQFYATIEQSDANLVLDWKGGTGFGGSVINSITRSIEGIEGNAIDMAINTGFVHRDDSVNVAADNNSNHLYVKSPPATTNRYLSGTTSPSGNTRLWIYASDTILRTTVLATVTIEGSVSSLGDIKGLISTYRLNATDGELYLDGVLKASTDAFADGVTTGTQPYYVMAYNINGTVSSYSDCVSTAVIHGSNNIDKLVASTIIENYLLRLKGYDIPLKY